MLWHKALDGSGPTLLYVSLRSTRAVRRVGAPIEGQGVFRPALYMLSTVRPRDRHVAEIRRRRAHPSFLRLLRLFNVDTGSAEIVHTYESDKTFAVSTVTLRHVTPPTPDAARPPRTRFQHGFTHAGTHAEIVLNGWSGCGWVLGRYRRYLRPRLRHVQHASPKLPPILYLPPPLFQFRTRLHKIRSGGELRSSPCQPTRATPDAQAPFAHSGGR